MRIARLDLIRFGKFTNHTLTFPAAATDLHLVFGPNEAGKSTLRQALLDWLYGIHARTPYNFKHAYATMEIGGKIEDADAKSVEFRRFKRTTNYLVTANGTTITDTDLAPWLDHTNRESFERMFAIDHAKLVAGEQSIVESGGDSGRMLFQATVGVTDLEKIRKAMDDEAKDLWGLPRRKEALYSVGEDRFEKAKSTIAGVSLTASRWEEADRALKTAQAAEEGVQAGVNSFVTRERVLERVKRVAVPLQQYHDALAARKTLGIPALLPEGADSAFAIAEAASEKAKIERTLLDRTQVEAAAKLRGITQAPALVAHKARIETLGARLAIYSKAVFDLPSVEAEIATVQEAVAAAARHLDWHEVDQAAVGKKVPSTLLRDDLSSLLKREQGLAHAVDTALTAHDAKVAVIAALDEQIAGAPQAAEFPALTGALAEARALNYTAMLAAAKAAKKTAEGQQADGFAALLPWQGTAETLRTQTPPAQSETTRFTVTRSELEALRKSADDDRQHKELALALARVASEHHEREYELVSADALRDQRIQRDRLWQALRSRQKDLDAEGSAYEREVRDADALADRRYDSADHIAKGRELGEAVLKLDIEVQELCRRIEGLDAKVEALDEAWNVRVAAAGFFLPLDQYPAWIKARDSALVAADAARKSREAQEALEDQGQQAVTALCAGLAQAGVASTDTDLAALIARAESVNAEHLAARTRRSGWVADCVRHVQSLPPLATAFARANGALEDWRAERARLLGKAGLSNATGAAGTERALLLFGEIEKNCRLATDLARRTQQMKDEIATFTGDAQSLATACAPALVALPPADISDKLTRLLREAEKAQTESESLADAMTDTQNLITANDRDEAAAAARLAPLYPAANVTTKDQLRTAIAHWTACREADAQVNATRKAVIDFGGGPPFAVLETEVAAEDLNLLDAELATVREQLVVAHTRMTTAVEVRTKAEADLGQYVGQDTAVRAEADKQDALLVMREAAEGHLRVALGAKLLTWALNRYSKKKQESLLKIAGDIFAKLTLGAFKGLGLDDDTNLVSTLYAYRANGSRLAIGKGLSTGTEAQLYLALRLALLHQHLDQRPAIPFLGDDLFLGWDEERSAAGIEVLAELAKRTQVILLTHSHRLMEIAQTAAGDRVSVTELPGLDSEPLSARPDLVLA